MNAQMTKAAVGAFALGGIVIFVAGLLLLGGGNLFSSEMKYVLYFDGSVSGLSIGAPVVFRGVPMGRVTQINLVANPRDSNVTIPVYIRIDGKSIVRAGGENISEDFQREIIRRMVQRGLRARLQMQSLITGQYRIELDFHPDEAPNFRSTTPALEIPTIPSPLDTLQRTLARIPLEEMGYSLHTILLKLSQALEGDKLRDGLTAFADSFAELQHLLKNSELRKSLDEVMQRVDNASMSMERELPAALKGFRQAMDNLARAAEAIQKSSVSLQQMLAHNSPAMTDLRRLLKEAAAAARSLHELTDMLERNPESLIRGKRGTR